MHVRPVHGARAVRPGRRLLPRRRRATRPRRRLPDRARAPSDLRRDAGPACSRRLGPARSSRDRFVVREHGAGTGALALAILDGLRAIRRWRRSATSRSRSRPPARRASGRGSPRPVSADASSRPTPTRDPVDGVVLANEVLDALPVHRVRQRGGRLREVARRLSADGAFVDVEIARRRRRSRRGSPTRASSSPTARRAEICLALDAWIADAAAGLRARPPAAHRLRLPGGRAVRPGPPARRHAPRLRPPPVHDDPYRHVGRQDLTAHVDVTAVERAAAPRRADHLGNDDPGRGPGRARHRGAAAGDPGRPGHRRSRPTWRSDRRSCACWTRPRWAASG